MFKATALNMFYKYMGDDETPADPGKMFNFLARNTKPVMAGLTGTGSGVLVHSTVSTKVLKFSKHQSLM